MAKRGRGKRRSSPSSPQPAVSSSPSSPQPAVSSSSAAQEAADTSHRGSDLVDGALPVLQSAIKVASAAAGDAAVPGLSIGLSALAEILEHIQTMKKTGEGVTALQEHIVKLSELVTDFCSHPQALPEETKKRINALSKTWENIAKQTERIANRSRVKRFLLAKSYAEKLDGLLKELNDSIQRDFLVGSLLSIEVGVAQAIENILRLRKDMQVTIEVSFMPTYAKGAQYDANNVRRACLQGTRVDLLEALQKWIISVCLQEGINAVRIVYWINGLAGTGKTTIAYSIAAWCRERGLLGASFCCSRFDSECSDPNFVFRTISRQLCTYFGPFKEKVAEILAKDSTLLHSGASRQFEELILRPLEELARDQQPFPRCVVVIDALDECKDEDTTSLILCIIAQFVSRIAPFLVFIITSRPEPRIAYLFGATEEGTLTLKHAMTPLLLHMVSLTSVSDDIRRYLEKRFADIRGIFMLKNWPSPRDLSRLVELSAGLFIWAATAVEFVADSNVSNPKKQLKALLDVQSIPQATQQTSQTILDPLYSQISRAAFSRISDTLAADLNPILGTIAIAQEPVSIVALVGLIDIDQDDVKSALTGLRSVLHIPDDDNEPIRVVHPTFAEYLLQSSPSKPEAFIIDANAQHMRLFSRTLKVMDGLEPNIASFPTPSTFRSEVVGLDNTLKEKISAALSYSSRHWSAHLGHCGDTGNTTTTLTLLDNFFRTRALTWLEACSLLDALDSSVAALQIAQKACRDYGGLFAPLAEFISDYLRLTQAYYACLDVAPLQVYHSLVSLAPIASLVKQQYARELKQSLLIPRGVLPDWGPCIAAWSGHQGSSILSVSFSADGVYFATGGGDGYIRIWRTATRTSVKAIPGGDGRHQVAFSPDGTRVASTPNLRIWDVKTGDVVHTLEHEGAHSVAYSADGSRLLSGSNGELKIWDTSTETCQCLDTITSVCAKWGMVVSPDGILVGGQVAGDSPAMYSMSSKALETFDVRGFAASLAAFSPDGSYAASHTSEVVTVWALRDKSLLRTINVSSFVWSTAFSHSSIWIGCGCNDGRVRIWTVASDDPPHVFTGHTSLVRDLAWSPDDTQVISVGDDGTIRVWDLTRHRSDSTLAASPPSILPPLPGAPCYAVLRTPKTTALFPLPAPIQPSTAASDAAEDAPIITLHADMADAWDAILRGDRASGEFAASRDWAFLTGRQHANMDEEWPVAMTQDGSLIAHRSSNREVMIYSHHTGDHVRLTLPSPRWPTALAFTSDNNRLAIADDEGTLCVQDITSQSNSPIWESELDRVSHAIAFSHDGSLLVIGMGNGDINVYDAATGKSVKPLHSTRGKVRQIAFSADDKHVIAQAHPWLIIWHVATGDQILEFTPTHNHFPHSFDFAADDTGILVPDGKGGTTKVILWDPGDRIWPVYTVTGDGWLYAKSPGKVRRLCWLPPEWRIVFSPGGPKLCVLDFDRKMTVVFDVSHIPEYVETWGAESEGALT